MWSKVVSLVTAVVGVFRKYPAYTAALLNSAVILAAHFGWHVTSEQLVTYAVFLNILLGALVHAYVTPTAKLPSNDE